MRGSPCVYCGAPDAPDMDHVPPRAIFPKKLPSEVRMVTAPSCKPCHLAHSKDDATIRNILISTRDSETHPEVSKGLAGRRDRSLARSHLRDGKEIQDLLQVLIVVDLKTPAGLFVGTDLAFNFDNRIMDRFVERLSRALLHYEFKQPFFEGGFSWRLNPDLPVAVYQGLQQFGKVRRVTDVFTYGASPFNENSVSWIVANFFGTVEFCVRVSKPETNADEL